MAKQRDRAGHGAQRPGGRSGPRQKASGPRPQGNSPRPQSGAPRPQGAASRPQSSAPRPKSNAPRPQGGAPRPQASAPRSQASAPRPQAKAPRPQVSAPRPQARPEQDRARQARNSGELWLYGHHAAAAALANPLRKILRIVATAEAAAKLSAVASIAPRILGQLRSAARSEIDQLVGTDAVHQGVAVQTHPLEFDLGEVLEGTNGTADACIIVLDQVTDPHNVGAILRSAAAFGAKAVVAPDRHAADESGAMAKAASGALDKIPYVKAGNLVRALELIKEHQFWLVGLDADAPQTLQSIKLGGKIALVVGAEGEGLRRLVRETCDHLGRLPMSGDMESLNVSNAAAVALYERARQVLPAKS